MRPAGPAPGAALRGPTPGISSSHGASAWTKTVSSACNWSASAARDWTGLGGAPAAPARWPGAPATWWAVPAGWRSAGSGWRCCGHSGSARNSSGAPTISALELTSGGYPRPGGAASGPLAARAGPLPLTPTPWAARWSWPSAPRAARTASRASLLAPVRLAGRLGRPTPGDPLAVLWQEPRQAGAEAARPPGLPSSDGRAGARGRSPAAAGSRPRRRRWWSGPARRRGG